MRRVLVVDDDQDNLELLTRYLSQESHSVQTASDPETCLHRLRAWKPGGGAEKWFCGDCGSALFSRDPEDATRVGVRLGVFDEDPGIRPAAHQFVAYAAPWEPIPDDGLPRYPEARVAD